MLRLSKLAASVLVGFYLRDLAEYEEWRYKMKAIARSENSLFSVHEKTPIIVAGEMGLRNETDDGTDFEII
jgi:hypothetical protein